MRSVRELAVVANRSTGRGGPGDEGEDEQEIFKALSLGECLLDGLRRVKWRRVEGKGKGKADVKLTSSSEFPSTLQNHSPNEC